MSNERPLVRMPRLAPRDRATLGFGFGIPLFAIGVLGTFGVFLDRGRFPYAYFIWFATSLISGAIRALRTKRADKAVERVFD